MGFRECGVADADKLTEWLVTNVTQAERRGEQVREELLTRLLAERIEPPTAGRIDRIVRSALHRGEELLVAWVVGRLPSVVRARLRELVSFDGGEELGETDGSAELASIRSEPGNVSLNTMLAEVAKLETVRAVGLPADLFVDVAPRVLAGWRARAAVEAPSHLRMVDGVIRHGTDMAVEANYVDSHGQSEIGFGVTKLLGFDLLPRIKRINKVKLYRPTTGEPDRWRELAPAMTRPIRWERIAEQYDQMLKYATAIRLETLCCARHRRADHLRPVRRLGPGRARRSGLRGGWARQPRDRRGPATGAARAVGPPAGPHRPPVRHQPHGSPARRGGVRRHRRLRTPQRSASTSRSAPTSSPGHTTPASAGCSR